MQGVCFTTFLNLSNGDHRLDCNHFSQVLLHLARAAWLKIRDPLHCLSETRMVNDTSHPTHKLSIYHNVSFNPRKILLQCLSQRSRVLCTQHTSPKEPSPGARRQQSDHCESDMGRKRERISMTHTHSIRIDVAATTHHFIPSVVNVHATEQHSVS